MDEDLRDWLIETAQFLELDIEDWCRAAKVPVAPVSGFLAGRAPMPRLEFIGRMADHARASFASTLKAWPMQADFERVGVIRHLPSDMVNGWSKAERNAEEWIVCPDHCCACYAVPVATNHMTLGGIFPGDLVVVDPFGDVMPGRFVALLLEGKVAVLWVDEAMQLTSRCYGEAVSMPVPVQTLGVVRHVQRNLMR